MRTERVRAESADMTRRTGTGERRRRANDGESTRRFDQPRDHEIRRQLRALREFGG